MKKKTVLIVDDEMDMRIFLTTLLETSGYRAVVTKNGQEGLRKARERRPDLVILDVMMPGEGGVQMYRQLRIDETLRPIPVIMLSAVAQKTFYHYLKMLTAQVGYTIPLPEAYMEKPPDAKELLRIAAELVQTDKTRQPQEEEL